MPTNNDKKNKCPVCGNTNEDKNAYCGICGTELNSDADNKLDETHVEDELDSLNVEQEVEANEFKEESAESNDDRKMLDEIEDGDVITEVRQVKSAWVWSASPWLIVILAIALFMEPITEVIAIMMAVVVIVPRFFLWLRSSYVLTENVLIYNRGGMIRTGTYKIPLSRITEVSENYGRFGRTLGYKSVVIKLANGVNASLAYIAPESDLHEQIAVLIEGNQADIDSDSESDTE
ncbi:MAG: zinc-ribbon domain-containing protein [SAR202 cluster bacterium]|nr:zinc-ribbon domain-containing protein [SAR202 cluster bacterium]|tara:strand:- start:1049 stop:1750 length:702 start_codon:yes stop_codon:yes gene_type:complete